MMYELFLTKKNISKDEWHKFIEIISKYNGYLKKWSINVVNNNNEIRYYLNTKVSLPPTINEINNFVMKKSNFSFDNIIYTLPIIRDISSNIIDLIEYTEIKKESTLKRIEIILKPLAKEKILSKVYLYIKKGTILTKRHLLFGIPSNILAANFEDNKRYIFKKVPKYLDITKSFSILNTDKNNSILQVDTFPYLQGDFYLKQQSYSFDKHSIVFGSSGSGKSKFLASYIKEIYNNHTLKEKYKIVVIDPHASLENDIGGLGKVVDFMTQNDSVNLFTSSNNSLVSNTELFVDLFKSLLANNYNAKIERILRHGVYLLLANNNFNFLSLRRLLLEVDYRTELINRSKEIIPDSVNNFFLTDFNEIKTKSYSEAISPIIAFIDEMQMLPVFNEENNLISIKDTINDNFLTLFSLDRTKFGNNITKTIAGLVMQGLFTIIEEQKIKEHIIFIIDEVAVIENDILPKYLSEARKFNLSLILAGQYFNQISKKLQDSIFANVLNYYIFRVSRLDACILANNFNMKVPLDDTEERKIKLLSELKTRECIVRIDKYGILLPAIKAKTIDFVEVPRIKNKYFNFEKLSNISKKEPTKISIGSASLKDILKKTSTSRKEVLK